MIPSSALLKSLSFELSLLPCDEVRPSSGAPSDHTAGSPSHSPSLTTMNVHFSPSLSPSYSPPPPPPLPPSAATSRLVALKAQIRKRNVTLCSSSRPLVSRRRSLLSLHQQAMELMTPESFDPFTEDAEDPATTTGKGGSHHRRERTDKAEEKEGGRERGGGTAGHSRSPSLAFSLTHSLGSTQSSLSRADALRLGGRPQPPAVVVPPSLKLSRRQLRDLHSQLQIAHPALVTHRGVEEEKEAKPPPPLPLFADRPSSLAALTLSAIPCPSTSSTPTPPTSSSSPSIPLTTTLAPPSPPSTPRLVFSQKRVEKFNESVKVMMSFSHSDMEVIRTEILKRGGGVSRAQFLAIAVKKRGGEEGYEREVEALTEMFEEIDVNGDGDLQYSEFTSYLVELANGRYDHHHIDQLLHTDYHHLEPTGNDDRIDVTMVRWYEGIGHFVMFEKGQHRFKVLDLHKKTVKVVRGHGGEMIDCEWLPSHRVLVTSSSDRTLRFWSVDDPSKAKEGVDTSRSVHPSRAPLQRAKAPATLPGVGSFPSFNCLSVWALPAPQVCLCWTKSRLYSADILGRLLVWNIDVGEIRTSIQAHEGRVTALIAATEEGALISGGMDGRVRVWDCQDMKCLSEWKHDGAVRALVWDSQRRLAISGGDDDCVRVWAAKTREVVRLMNFRQESEREARKKEANAGRKKRPLDDVASRVQSGDSVLGLSLTKEEVLVLSQYGVIRVLHLVKWNVEQTLILPRVWEDREDKEEDSEDEEEEGAKEEHSLRARELVTSFTCVRGQPIAPPLPLAFSTPTPPRENVMVVSAGSVLYSFTRDSAVNHLIADSHPVLSSIYNPDSFSIITAAHRSLKVWDCITGRLLKEFHDITPKGTSISSVCLDGRGRKIIVAASDGRVIVFNCNTGAEMQHLDRHESEVLNLHYIEEVVKEGEQDNDPTGGEEEGINKVLCSCKHGVYIHHDDHEADVSESAYTSLYHASFDHHGDITALTSSTPFGIIASASSDASIIFYPANLDGTPLQKLYVGSTVTALMFLHPYRLLVAAAGQGVMLVYCVANQQHVLIGQWVNTSPNNDPSNVVCMALDPFTETLYTGDESGYIKAYPLSTYLFNPFRALLDTQGLQPSSMLLPDRQEVGKFFSYGLSGVLPCLVIQGHRGSVASVGVIQGREGKWTSEANERAAQREREVQREEEEWKETMKESYESAVYRTAQLLYEGEAVDADRLSPRSPRTPTDPPNGTRRGSLSSDIKLPSSCLPMTELLTLLSPTHTAQLAKERKRISRQLQLEFDEHFASLRAQHTATHAAALHSLDLSYGSPTAVLSSGADGCVHMWSTEGEGDCLGSLQQGEVATLGRGTPAQWRYYANIEQRKTWERERLSECIQSMEEERARWKESEEQRMAEEAIAGHLREEELAGREEEEDDPNDALPHVRAATKEQAKLLDAVEEEATQTINSPSFQAKLHPRVSTVAPGQLPPIAFASSSGPPPTFPSTVVGLPLVFPSISPPPPPQPSFTAVMEGEVKDVRSRRSSMVRTKAEEGEEEGKDEGKKTPSLRLSRYQQMMSAVAKAIPLHRSGEGEEEKVGKEEKKDGDKGRAISSRTVGGRGGSTRPGTATAPSSALEAGEKRRLAKAIARQLAVQNKASS